MRGRCVRVSVGVGSLASHGGWGIFSPGDVKLAVYSYQSTYLVVQTPATAMT